MDNEMIAATRRLIAETDYAYGSAPGAGSWLNGLVTLKDDRRFKAGGGWIDTTGLVEPYNYRDTGQVDELADALGLDIEDTLQLLRDDCPKAWPA